MFQLVLIASLLQKLHALASTEMTGRPHIYGFMWFLEMQTLPTWLDGKHFTCDAAPVAAFLRRKEMTEYASIINAQPCGL